MTKRVQVLAKEWIKLDCIDKYWNISDKTIKHLSIVEITDYSYDWTIFHKPNSLRLVNKPKPRYYNERILVIWTAILSYIAWVLTNSIK